MRQVQKLLQVIRKAHLIDFYMSLLSYGTIQRVKLPSLEEFLTLSLGNNENNLSSFDPEAEKELEELAQRNLEERRRQYEQRLINKN